MDEGFVSTVTLSELWVGFYRAQTPDQRSMAAAILAFVPRLLAVLPFDADAARIRAALWVDLRTGGISVGERDLQIAATALAHGHDLLTANVAEFSRIPGLRVIPWAGRTP
jgi:tRNA(fMet)-specific endonuclease VapC